MKKCLILLLCVCLVTALTVPPAGASEEASPLKLEYALRIEGDMEAGVTPGDTVTVVFSLQRSDGGSGSYALRILQNEILFDESFFEYVPDSATVLKSGNALYQTRTDGTHIIKASYLSSNGGSFGEQEDFCSFRLRVKAAEGTGWVRCDPECAKAYDGDNLRVTIQPAEELRLTASGACHPFEDVQKTDWYHEAVDYVWQHGLMNGMGDNRFEPGTTMTRAMVVTASIPRCVEYYYAISKCLADRHSPYKALIAFSGEHKYKGAEPPLTSAGLNFSLPTVSAVAVL